MLSASERIISILICILLAVIIKINFFNNDSKVPKESTYNKGILKEQPSIESKLEKYSKI